VNGLLQLCLYGVRPEHAPRNVWRAILHRKGGYEQARLQREARELKAVQGVVAAHSAELAELGVTP
jgi:hypothetical protein